MNVFYIDTNPNISAQFHCDAHLRKMIIEYAQMLSSVHWLSEDEHDQIRAVENNIYRPVHLKHPSSIWVRHHPMAYSYVFNMWDELHKIYIQRYNKQHASYRLRETIINLPQPLIEKLKNCVDNPWYSPPPMCFGKEYEHIKKGVDPTSHESVVQAYREYYRQGKSKFATWGGDRSLPRWWLRVA